METIERERAADYSPPIDENKPLGEQGLSRDAIAMIAMLHRDYWCDNDEEKEALLDLLETNEHNFKGHLENTTSTRELMRLLKDSGAS